MQMDLIEEVGQRKNDVPSIGKKGDATLSLTLFIPLQH